MKQQHGYLVPLIVLSTLLLPQLIGCGEDTPTTPDNSQSLGNGKIYVTRVNGDVPELLIMNADGTDQRVLGDSIGVICSPQAGKILMVTVSGKLTLTDLDGNVIRSIPTPETPVIAVLSPDASKICYGYRSYDSAFESTFMLRIVNADGTGDVLITDNGGNENTIAFSPDSKRIAFYLDEEWDTPDKLFTVNTDGTDMRLVTDNALSLNDRYGAVAWSPDGERILFMRSDPAEVDAPKLWSIGTDGSDARELTNLSVPNGFFPIISPEGTTIAFCGIDSGATIDGEGLELWMANSDGSNKRRLTNTPGRNDVEVRPEWSPDGKSIVYVSFEIPDQGDPFTGKLMSIDVATGVSKVLIATPDIFSAYWGRK